MEVATLGVVALPTIREQRCRSWGLLVDRTADWHTVIQDCWVVYGDSRRCHLGCLKHHVHINCKTYSNTFNTHHRSRLSTAAGYDVCEAARTLENGLVYRIFYYILSSLCFLSLPFIVEMSRATRIFLLFLLFLLLLLLLLLFPLPLLLYHIHGEVICMSFNSLISTAVHPIVV